MSEVKSSIVIDVRFSFFFFSFFAFNFRKSSSLERRIDFNTNNCVQTCLQFNLVCDYAIYPTIGLVALNTGGPIGVYLFGTLNDR